MKNTSNFTNTLTSRITGALYGAFIADSIGSDVEFSETLSSSQINSAMKMNGSSIFNSGPGQITDDSELAICLGLSLDSPKLDLDKIALKYGEWFKTGPFDIGITTTASTSRSAYCDKNGPAAELMIEGAKTVSNSLSNGCLMKVMPLCIWCRNLPFDQLYTAISSECELTHVNPYAHYTNYTYALLVKLMLNEEYKDYERIDYYMKLKALILIEKNSDLVNWINECFDLVEHNNFKKQAKEMSIGFIKLAFCISLYVFIQNLDYNTSIREVLSFCGDTDTNAAICGGLIGCYLGEEKIDKKYKECLMAFDGKKGIMREEFLYPKNSFMKVVDNVKDYAPGELEIVKSKMEK